MIEIPIGKTGLITVIDDADYDLVAPYSWQLHVCRRNKYARRRWYENGHGSPAHGQFMHALLTGWAQTDHVDHDGLNNQRENLREATSSSNRMNSRKPQMPTSSKYKGVSWNAARQKWIVMAGREYLGYFDDETEAALAYNTAACRLFGDYACLNEV